MEREDLFRQLAAEVKRARTRGDMLDIRSLAQAHADDASDLLRYLLVVDFDCAWEAGKGQPVEIVLRDFPELRLDADSILQLIASEMRWMQAEPEEAEYLDRFPQQSTAIAELFKIYRAVGDGEFGNWLGHSIDFVAKTREFPTIPVQLAEGITDNLGRHSLTDNFRIVRRLGAGGCKEVFEAEQESTGQRVAIKLSKLVSEQTQSQQMFLREARTQARLNHQNIPAVFGLGLDSKTPGLIVEQLVSGRPWSELLPTLNLEENLRILQEVCEAVAFAHRRHGIIHRDIKPANVMINDEFGEVYLLDWGLALGVSDNADEHDEVTPHVSRAVGISGTPEYMAPEMALGRPETCTTRTDVFLLGGVLYHILTGVPPYYSDEGGHFNALEALYRAGTGQIIPPHKRTNLRKIPEELGLIAWKALSFDQADRYNDAGEFTNALFEYQRQAQVERVCADAAERFAMVKERRGNFAPRQQAPVSLTMELIGIADAFHNAYRMAADSTESDGTAESPSSRVRSQRAREGEQSARLELVDLAICGGDHGLAAAQLSLLDSDVDVVQKAQQRLVSAQRQRQRDHLVRRTAVVLAIVSVVIAVGTYVILLDLSREKLQADLQHEIDLRIAQQDAETAKKASRIAAAKQLELATQADPAFDSAALIGRSAGFARSEILSTRPGLSDSEQWTLVPMATSSRRILTRNASYLSPHGILVTDDVFGHLHVYRLSDGTRLKAFATEHQSDPHNSLYPLEGFSPVVSKVPRVATAGPDGFIQVWNLAEGVADIRFDPSLLPQKPRWTTLAVQPFPIERAKILAGDESGTVAWLKNVDGKLAYDAEQSGHQAVICTAAWKADGQQCATGSVDGWIHFWTPAGDSLGKLHPAEDNDPSANKIIRIAYSPQSDYLAAACRNGHLYLIDTVHFEVTRVLKGHDKGRTNSAVTTVAWVNKTRLVSGGDDGTIRLWNTDADSFESILGRHEVDVLGMSTISTLAVPDDGRELMSNGTDGTITRWDLKTAKPIMRLEGTQEMGASQVQASCADFDPHTARCLIAGMGRYSFLYLFDSNSTREIKPFREELSGPPSSMLAPSTVCLEPAGEHFLIGERNGDLSLWSTIEGKKLKSIASAHAVDPTKAKSAYYAPIVSLAWSDDRKRVASLGADGRLKVWQTSDWQCVADDLLEDEAGNESLSGREVRLKKELRTLNKGEINSEASATELASRRAIEATALIFGTDASDIIVMGPDQLVRVWDYERRKWQARFSGHLHPVTAITFLKSKGLVVSGDRGGNVLVWDYRTQVTQSRARLTPLQSRFSPYIRLDTGDSRRHGDSHDPQKMGDKAGYGRTAVQSTAVSPDGRLLAVSLSDGTIRLLDVKSGATLHIGAGHEFGNQLSSWHAAFFSKSGTLNSVGSDGTVRRWDLRPWSVGVRVRPMVDSVRQLTVGQSTGTIAAVTFARTLVLGEAVGSDFETVDLGREKIGAAVFLPGDEKLALATVEGELLIWNRRSRQVEVRLVTTAHQSEHESLGIEDAITTLAIRGDGREVLSNARADSTIVVWNLDNGKAQVIQPSSPTGGRYYAIAYRADGEEFAAMPSSGRIDRWSRSLKHLGRLPVAGPGATPLSHGLAYTPDGHFLIQSGFDPDILVWNYSASRVHQRIPGHRADLQNGYWSNSPVFFADGTKMATAGGDGIIRIWQVEPDKKLTLWSSVSTRTLSSYQLNAEAASEAVTSLPEPATFELYSVGYDPIGQRLVTAGSVPELRSYSFGEIRRELDQSVESWHERVVRSIGLTLNSEIVQPQRTNQLRRVP